jgi:hypothetical protein
MYKGMDRPAPIRVIRLSNKAIEEAKMTICTKCGAESGGGATCPCCGATLPADRSAKALTLASGIIAAACGLGASIDLIVDYARSGALGSSLIGLASFALAWILVGFPMISYRKPELYLPVMGAAILAYLWILDLFTGASGWFLSLALPMTLATMASGAFSALLCVKAKQRGPNIAAFILFGCTFACLAVDGILSVHFRGFLFLTWSVIVAASALPVAFLLLGVQGRLRPSLSSAG